MKIGPIRCRKWNKSCISNVIKKLGCAIDHKRAKIFLEVYGNDVQRTIKQCNINRTKEKTDMKEYNYSYNDDTRELTIYEDNCVLATISDVEEEQTDEMFKEVIFELREIKL